MNPRGPRFVIRCYACGEMGHKRMFCRNQGSAIDRLKAELERKEKELERRERRVRMENERPDLRKQCNTCSKGESEKELMDRLGAAYDKDDLLPVNGTKLTEREAPQTKKRRRIQQAVISSDEDSDEEVPTPLSTLADRVKLQRRQVSLLADGTILCQQDTAMTPHLVKPGDIVKHHGVILYFNKK